MTIVAVEAHVKPQSLSTAFSSTRTVTGIIYFSSEGFTFPEDVWDDFPVIIVGWWLNALAEYAAGAKDTAELYFMDGPFHVLVSQANGASARLEMVERAWNDEHVVHAVLTDMRSLYRSIDAAADTLIEFCEKQPREVPDYPELIEAKRRARDVFSRKENTQDS